MIYKNPISPHNSFNNLRLEIEVKNQVEKQENKKRIEIICRLTLAVLPSILPVLDLPTRSDIHPFFSYVLSTHPQQAVHNPLSVSRRL